MVEDVACDVVDIRALENRLLIIAEVHVKEVGAELTVLASKAA